MELSDDLVACYVLVQHCFSISFVASKTGTKGEPLVARRLHARLIAQEDDHIYAHVNIWQLNEPGSSTDDTAAREIGTQVSQQPGFDSYTVVRTA